MAKHFPRFTLIELLVVIGIIAILASMLLPALTRAKAVAHRAACMNQQKQIFIAYEFYRDDHGDYYLPDQGSGYASGGTGVARDLLPYLSSDQSIFLCPSKDPDNFGGYYPNSYGTAHVTLGSGTIAWRLSNNYKIGTSGMFDKPEMTCLTLDSHHDRFNAYQCLGKPGVTINPSPTNIVEWRHLNKLNVLYFDGHVEPLAYDLPNFYTDVYFWWSRGKWHSPPEW